MKIMKRSGVIEDFFTDKLKISLAAISDEANQPLNESDLNLLILELDQITKEKELITTDQLTVIMAGLLYTTGFIGVLEYWKNQKWVKAPQTFY